MTDLFTPITIKGKVIKNRVVLPPMVCKDFSDVESMVSARHIKHYEQIADGGCGLIIIEALAIASDARITVNQLGIWSDKHIEGIKKITEACHKYGAVVIAQLIHGGYNADPGVTGTAYAPSDYNDGTKTARALNPDQIGKIKNDFIRAAKRAQKAGLDGVELHGAHGFLLNQFASPIINKRDDQYGVSLPNRLRFACEIIEMIKDETEGDFIIGYRMGGNEPNLKQGKEIAKILENAGVDLLHVSSGIEGDTIPEPPPGFDFSWIVYCGTEIKKIVGLPTIVVGKIKTPDQGKYLIEKGLADFVAIGKGHLCDPRWTNKASANLEVIECQECKKCFWFDIGGYKKCPVYSLKEAN